MRFGFWMIGCLCAASTLLPFAAVAQQAPSVSTAYRPDESASPLAVEAGVRVGYGWDPTAWSVGGQLRLPIVPGFYLIPSGDLYPGSSATSWQLNLDAAFRLGWYGGLYGGAGLGIAHGATGSSRTETGLNVIAGFTPPRIRRQPVWPFVEARWLLIQNRSPFGVRVGLNVLL